MQIKSFETQSYDTLQKLISDFKSNNLDTVDIFNIEEHWFKHGFVATIYYEEKRTKFSK